MTFNSIRILFYCLISDPVALQVTLPRTYLWEHIVSELLKEGKYFCFQREARNDDFRSRGRVKNCLFSTAFRPALGPTQPQIEWAPRGLSAGI
jgi:hypothetical protein